MEVSHISKHDAPRLRGSGAPKHETKRYHNCLKAWAVRISLFAANNTRFCGVLIVSLEPNNRLISVSTLN